MRIFHRVQLNQAFGILYRIGVHGDDVLSYAGLDQLRDLFGHRCILYMFFASRRRIYCLYCYELYSK